MYCNQINKDICATDCPPIITGLSAGAELQKCMACKQGQLIAKSAVSLGREAMPPKLTVEQVLQEQTAMDKAQVIEEHVKSVPPLVTVTIQSIAKACDIESSSVRNVVRGKTRSGKHYKTITAWLAARGLTLADVQPGKTAKKSKPASVYSGPEFPPPVNTKNANIDKTVNDIMQPSEPDNADLDRFRAVYGFTDPKKMPLEEALRLVRDSLPHGVKFTIEF